MAVQKRRVSVPVKIGNVTVGGNHPIVVQSMTNTDTADVASTVNQVMALAQAGSELVRVTVNTEAASNAKVLETSLLEKVKPCLQAIKPLSAVFDRHYVKRLNGHNVKKGRNKMELAQQVRSDIYEFKKSSGSDRMVMIWSAKKNGKRAGKSSSHQSNLRRRNISIRNALSFPLSCSRIGGPPCIGRARLACFLRWDYRPRPGFARRSAVCNSLPNTLAAQSGIVCVALLNSPPMK